VEVALEVIHLGGQVHQPVALLVVVVAEVVQNEVVRAPLQLVEEDPLLP
jgi:hypothetical protein